jgi:hypothetical protein
MSMTCVACGDPIERRGSTGDSILEHLRVMHPIAADELSSPPGPVSCPGCGDPMEPGQQYEYRIRDAEGGTYLEPVCLPCYDAATDAPAGSPS